MKILKVMMISILGLVLFDSNLIAKSKYPKSLYSVLIRNDGTSIQTFDGGITFSITELKNLDSSSDKPVEENEYRINTVVYPNPFVDDFFISIEMKDKSYIKVYSLEMDNRKNYLFEGFLNEGENSIRINSTKLNRGLIFLFIEEDGVVLNKVNAIKLN